MLINGEPGHSIDASDRGFIYADGLFETIRVINSQLTLWDLHRRRLTRSCKLLSIPLDLTALQRDLKSTLSSSATHGIIKIIMTRGPGGRGYKPFAEVVPTRIVQFHQLPTGYEQGKPNGVKVKFCDHPLSTSSRLGGIKHLGRLDQVMASSELTEEFDEGIMVTDAGHVIEGTRSNLFAVVADKLLTPDLKFAGVAGVMREYLISRFTDTGHKVEIVKLTANQLLNAAEIFLCNSVFGVWPVAELVRSAAVQTLPIGPISRLALEFQDDEFDRYL